MVFVRGTLVVGRSVLDQEDSDEADGDLGGNGGGLGIFPMPDGIRFTCFKNRGRRCS